MTPAASAARPPRDVDATRRPPLAERRLAGGGDGGQRWASKLAGPRVYGGTLVDDAFMGCGRRGATAADIRRALRLYRLACGIEALALAAAAVALWTFGPRGL